MSPLEAAVTVLQQLWRTGGPEYREVDEAIAKLMLAGMHADQVWLGMGYCGGCRGWGHVRQVMMGRRRKTKGR